MVILLYGEDSYRRRQKIKELSSDYRKKRGDLGFNRFNFSTLEESFSSFREFVQSTSLFDPAKMAIVDNLIFKEIKDLGLSKDFKKLIESNIDASNTVIILSADSKPTIDFKYLLSDKIKSQEFKKLEGEQLKSFIKKESETRGVKISNEDLFSLINYFGSDLWGIITELDKMEISGVSPVLSLSGGNYFQTLNLFKYGSDPRHRLISLEVLLSELKEDPARIFNSLPYGRPATKRWYETLADYDASVKSGKLDYAEVLVDLAID